MRQDTLGDYTSRTLAILALSIPAFWVAILVVVYPSIWWSWAPPLEYIPPTEDLVGNYFQFLIPGSIMGLYMFGTTLRMIRTMMLEVLRQDYIRTAWAKGLSERTVIFRHALKNALIPIVTIVGMQLPILIGGSIVIESIFVLPGVGRYMIEAISQRDYPVITAINLFFAVSMLTANLLVDISYAYLDPRIKYK
jgi:peptide/nickel transport system permease protein